VRGRATFGLGERLERWREALVKMRGNGGGGGACHGREQVFVLSGFFLTKREGAAAVFGTGNVAKNFKFFFLNLI